MGDCVFCKIVSRELPADIVFEDEKCVVFHDKYPLAKGHIIVALKTHYSSAAEVPLSDFQHVAFICHHTILALIDILRETNIYTIGLNEHVKHFHFHLVPKNERIFLALEKAIEGSRIIIEQQEIAEICSALQRRILQ